MGEILEQAYEKAEEITSSTEYRFLAKLYTDVLVEKECLKSKIRTLIAENLELTNELWKLKREKK